MRIVKNILFVIALFLLSSEAFSQGTLIPGTYVPSNYEFMTLNGPGVTCRSGKYYLDGIHPYMTNPNFDYSYWTTEGINPEDHQLITQSGKDPHTGNNLDILPAGLQSVIKLGNDRTDYGYPGHAQDIAYVFDVDPLNSILLLKFAVVFQEANDHNMENKAFFSVRVSDVNNNILESCAEYEVSALAGLDGFVSAPGNVLWRDWSTIGIDLSRYAGSQVKVTFTTKGCRQGEHFGYAYFHAQCIENSISAASCNLNSITLVAPPYFQSYTWSLSAEDNDTITYELPANGELSVSCHLVSFTGCQLDLMATIVNNTSYNGQTQYYDEQHCRGTSYEQHGFNIDANELNVAGDYTFINTIIGYNNCDNPTNIILTLHVVDQIHVNYAYDICENEEFHALGWDITNPVSGTQLYQHNGTSYKGCDSIATLTLITHDAEYTTDYDSVCRGQSYYYHGNSINTQTAGLVSFDHHGSTPEGCDHTYHLNLYVNEVYNYTIYDSICQGDTYNNNGFNVTPNGTGTFNYVYNGTTVNGCDSIVHLSLVVNPIVEYSINASICGGQSYNENGFTVSGLETGSYPNIQTNSGTTIHGCDSIVHLNLEVHDIIGQSIYASIPYGNDYEDEFFHIIHPEVGHIDSTLHLTTQYGCAHNVTLHLTVNPTYYIEFNDEVCYGQEYHNAVTHFDITQALSVGTHDFYQNLQTVAFADSTVVLHLTVRPAYPNEVINDEICIGNDYSQYGFSLVQPSAGIHIEIHNDTTVYGCDSIVTLNLNVLANLESTRNASVCDGESYHDDLFNISSIGLTPGLHVYQETLTSVSGCDSIVTLNLTVGESKSIYINDYACQYDVYDTLGFYIELTDSIPHEYRDTLFLQTSIGCDSTVYLNVGTAPVNIVRYYDEICYGGSYHNFGFDIDNPAPDHYVLRRNVYLFPGLPCPDTIHELTLDVWPLVDSLLYDTICEGEDYFRNGFQKTASTLNVGMNLDTLYTSSCHGCDSTVYLFLTVNPLLERVLNIDVCEHDHFQSYGFDIPDVQMNEPQHVLHTPSLVTGCDSTVYLNLNVNDILYNNIEASICLGEIYNEYGFYKDPQEVGTVYDTLPYTSQSGCDSLVCLMLTVNPVYDMSFAHFIGEGSSYQQGAFNIINPPIGVYNYDTLLYSVNGCDSLVHLELSVYETYGIIRDTIICYGDNYIDNDFTYIAPEVGDYQGVRPWTTIHGVDSTIYLNLHVKPVFDTTWNRMICLGEDLVEYPFDIIAPGLGINYFDTTFYTVYGCDSIIRLELDVKPTYDTLITTFIGTGYSYVENGFSIILPDEGLYEMDSMYYSVNGCDSLVRLHLDVYPTKQTYLYDSICVGEDYDTLGFQMFGYGVGTYDTVLNLYTVHNVDSTVYLTLDVNEVFDYTIDGEICQGDSYNDYNFEILVPPVGHLDTLQRLHTIHGCDSIVRLSLEVYPTYDNIIIDSVCYGDVYSDYDQNFTVNSLLEDVGLFTDSVRYPTVHGCDSVIRLYLNINPVYDLLYVDTICHKESYNDHGFVFQTPDPGLWHDSAHYYTVSGCDSIVQVDLLVNPHHDTLIIASICHGEDYTDNGFEFLQPGVGMHPDTLFLNNIYGCDSTVAINLYVYPTYETPIVDTICYDEDYIANGFQIIFPELGVTEDTLFLSSIHGCDSTVYLHLQVNPTFFNWFEAEICEGDEYHGNGFNEYNKPLGMNYDTLRMTTIYGCDSIAYLELLVNPTSETALDAAICEGEDYTDNGFNIIQPAPGDSIYSLVLPNEYGCDSTVNLSLTVWPDSYRYLTDTVCHGVDYLLYGFKIIQAEVGTAYDTLFLTNSHGCDSTVFMALTVLPEYDTTYYDTICFGDDYLAHGFEYLQPAVGHYIDTLMLLTWQGCDSIIYLDLTVGEVHDTLFTDMICEGEDYTQHGFNILQPAVGFRQDTLLLTNSFGCDSTIFLNLTVAERADTLIVVDICEGEDYIGNGFEYIQPAAGDYYDSLNVPPLVACDSMVYLELHVHDIFITEFNDTICEGEDYIEHGFVFMQPIADVYLDTLPYVTASGCDSLVTLTLTVNPRYDITILDTICQGETYDEYGFLLDSLDVGVHYDTLNLATELGCDSIIMLELTVNPRYDISIFDTVCDGGTYYEYGFEIDSLVVGVMYDTLSLTTELGCDSIIMLELTVNPRHDIAILDTICEGEDYDEYGFTFLQPSAGLYLDTLELENQYGCDSIVSLALTVNPRHDITLLDTVCEGGTYEEYGFEIDSLVVGVMYDTLNLANIYGCDSIVMLELTVNPRHLTNLFDTVCSGGIYEGYGFEIDSLVVGVMYDTLFLENEYGCDSIVTLELTVNPRYDISILDTICFGEDYENYGFTVLQPLPGMHFDTLNLQTINGCDSIVMLELAVGSIDTTNIEASICFGESYTENGFNLDSLSVGLHYDTLLLTSLYGCDSLVTLELTVNPVHDTLFVDEICEGLEYNEHGFSFIAEGVGMHHDTLWLSNIFGCDSIVRLDLMVNPNYEINFDEEICEGYSYTQHGFDYVLPEPGMYYDTLFLQTIHGCDSIVTLALEVHPKQHTLIEAHKCFGEDYEEHGFHYIQPEVGFYLDSLIHNDVFGCDSIVTLNLYVHELYDITITDTICEGDSYFEYGFEVIRPDLGIYYDTLFLTSIYGCDSVVKLELTTLPILRFDGVMTGTNIVYPATNMQLGRYEYHVPPVEHCEEYNWTLTPPGSPWIIEDDGPDCVLWVTTEGHYQLKVKIGNICHWDSLYKELYSAFFDIDETMMEEVSIYPNPTKGQVAIECPGMERIIIQSLTGQIMRKEDYDSSDRVVMELETLPRGTYIVIVETKQGRAYKQIVVER